MFKNPNRLFFTDKTYLFPIAVDRWKTGDQKVISMLNTLSSVHFLKKTDQSPMAVCNWGVKHVVLIKEPTATYIKRYASY